MKKCELFTEIIENLSAKTIKNLMEFKTTTLAIQRPYYIHPEKIPRLICPLLLLLKMKISGRGRFMLLMEYLMRVREFANI